MKSKANIATKTQTVTKTHIALATAFLGASMLAAAATGIRTNDRSQRNAQPLRNNVVDVDVTRSNTIEQPSFVHPDLVTTFVDYNMTKNFVDFEKYGVDVVAIGYKNIGNSKVTSPFKLRIAFDRSLHLAKQRGKFVKGIYHITGDSKYTLDTNAAQSIGEEGVYPGEGSVTIFNTVTNILPEDTLAKEFIIPVTSTEESNNRNKYDLAPQEPGYVYLIVPKSFKEEIEEFGYEVTVTIDVEDTVKEGSNTNNTFVQEIFPIFGTSQSGYCPGFGECIPSFFGACKNFFYAENKCEAFVESL